MTEQTSHRQGWVVGGLLLIGIGSRLVAHPWNATPLMAIALFSGAYLAKRWALILPLAIVAISDLFLGWHETIPFTWGAFALTGIIGWWLRSRPSPLRILTAALAGSVSFYLITNFGVWITSTLYPRTVAGVWECYVAAIPFFRGSLLGDLIYTGAFFGLYNLFELFGAVPASVPSSR